MKQEWKKFHKNLYGIKTEPVLLDVPAQQFIMIDGEGNPNAADFSERVGALYSLAYAVKMGYKKTAAGREVDDFAVYPLEGVWRQKTQAGRIGQKQSGIHHHDCPARFHHPRNVAGCAGQNARQKAQSAL
mgnify:CR=1 FL=1